MAAARKPKRTRRTPAKKAPASAVSRIKADLPPSLAEFARKVQAGLSRVQREIEGSQASREFLRLLREASHRLGRLEAEGEKRWKKLAGQARKDAVKLLKRVEKALAPPKPKAPRAPAPSTPPVSAPSAPPTPGPSQTGY